MEEKRKDLKSTRQKEIITNAVAALNESHPDFYYLSTIELAAKIKEYLHQPGNIGQEEFQIVKDLSRQDIQILMSLHEH